MRSSQTAPSILMVSKPVAPPWNDSSKNLVKDLALAGQRFTYRVMTTQGYELAGPQVHSEPIYRETGRYTPALVQNARVLARLLRRDGTAVTHFFFAPNPRTSSVARLSLRLRARRTVQTVCSAPRSFANPERLLFADRVVVLSKHTESAFLRAGAPPARLRVIAPGIRPPEPLTPEARRQVRRRFDLPTDAPLVIYPGDYQFSDAAETVARAALALADSNACFVFACRIKQEASRQKEAQIRDMLAAGGLAQRARLLNEVPEILELLGACDLCVLPAESLYAKMDLPLVLLESLALRVPIVVADVPPLNELLVGEIGAAVPPRDPAALATAIRALLASPEGRLRLGEAGRALVQDRFSIAHVVRRYEDLYEELLREPPAGA